MTKASEKRSVSSLDDIYAPSPDYSMTFSPTGVVAIMVKVQEPNEGDPYTEPGPVESWGPNGEPMMFWGGRMVDATTLPEFQGLRKGRRAVGVVPGGGWGICAPHTDEAFEESEQVIPVVAWVVTDSSSAVPLIPTPSKMYPLAAGPADEFFGAGEELAYVPPAGGAGG